MKQQPRLATIDVQKDIDAHMRNGFKYGRALFRDLGDGKFQVMFLYRDPKPLPDRMETFIRSSITNNVARYVIAAGDKESPLGFTPNEPVACLTFLATEDQLAKLPNSVVFVAVRSKGAERVAQSR